MSPLHHYVKGLCHDSTPLLLPAGGLGPLAVLFFATVIVVMNLLVDLSYAWLDPRIRYS